MKKKKKKKKKRDQLKGNRQFDEHKKRRNCVSTQVGKAKRKYFSQRLNDKTNVSSIWKAINIFPHKNRSYNTSAVNIPPDSLNDHFLSLFSRLLQSLMGSSDPDGYVCTSSLLDFCRERRSSSHTFHIPLLSVYEVGKLITGLNSKRSMGPDDIPARLLKLALPYIVKPLTYIYNLCIQRSVFPKMLKTAKVVPLPKNIGRSDPNNFRPISLLSVVSKPLERHVHNHLSDLWRITAFFTIFSLDLDHSTRVTLLCLHCVTCAIFYRSLRHSRCCVFSFKKAFDLVDHTILQQKLKAYLNNPSIFPFFHSYLSDRLQYVCVKGKLSAVGAMQTGVPQGSILGPLLFCIFINDLPLHLPLMIHLLTRAEKTLKEIEVRLQKSITVVSDWCNKNRMCLHPEKTKCIVITTRQKHQHRLKKLMENLYCQCVL